jgi:FkbM family methyltransferase
MRQAYRSRDCRAGGEQAGHDVTIRDHWLSAAPPLANHRFDAPLVIYGAGGCGRAVAGHLASRGVAVEAFIDMGAQIGETRDGVAVHTLAQWLARAAPASRDVLISLHNPFAKVADVIDELKRAGFRRVLTMVDYVNSVDDPTFRYWLAPAAYLRDRSARIDTAVALFADSASRDWMEASLRLRLLGDYRCLPDPTFEDQYMPADMPRWTDPMRLIDCGAYNGDSIDWFERAGYTIDALVAFEPDPASYALLATRCAHLNAALAPCGVADTVGQLSFAVGNGPSSRVDEGAVGAMIQCVAIDQAFPNFAPTLIKMDVEGSELAALKGAVRTLQRRRPGLAISLYHEPDHLWEIPLFLASLDLGYRMHLRGHGHNNYDLVLYCLPE